MLLPILVSFLALLSVSAAQGNAFGQLGQQAAARQARRSAQIQNVKALHDSTIWPGSTVALQQLEAGNMDALPFMANDARGQIWPLGHFEGKLAVGEYYYGLSGPLPNGPPVPIYIGAVTYQKPVTCDENVCSSYVVYNMMATGTNFVVANLTHHSTFFMDADDRIAGFLVTFENLGRNSLQNTIPAQLPQPWAGQYANATTEGGRIDVVNDFVVRAVICPTHEAICRPTGNAVYADAAECVTTLLARSLASWEVANARNNHCGYVHSRMIPANPGMHCSHIGPDDPMKCRPDTPTYWYDRVPAIVATVDPEW